MKSVHLIFLTLCLVAWAGSPASGATSQADPVTDQPAATIAVLPFVMHTTNPAPTFSRG